VIDIDFVNGSVGCVAENVCVSVPVGNVRVLTRVDVGVSAAVRVKVNDFVLVASTLNE
jgi:hypothetical protein